MDKDGNENLRSAKMRNTPVGKLLFSMSLPAILSMLVQALYNVVDSVFVANYSKSGLVALSYAFPLQMLLIAFAVGIGVGANAKIAKRLGEGKREEASLTASNGLFMALISAGVFLILGLTASKPFVSMFTSDKSVIDMGGEYLAIVLALSFGSFVEIHLSKCLQATGNMKIPMISQLIGAGVNIILDPIFIFTFNMGVKGAAIATVIGQITAMSFVILVYIFRKHDIAIKIKGFRPSLKYIGEICSIGFPTMVMNAISSVTTTLMNAILSVYSNGVAILGIYFKLQSFVFMPVFGLTQGALPILSYNYGSGDRKRFDRTFRLTLITAFIIMAAGLMLFQAGAEFLMRIFAANGEFLSEGALALRIISICFLPAAFGISVTTMFQSLGSGLKALVMSLLRQVVFILPLAVLFSFLWKMPGVWISYPVSEAAVFAIFLPVAFATKRKKFALTGSGEECADIGTIPAVSEKFADSVLFEKGSSDEDGKRSAFFVESESIDLGEEKSGGVSAAAGAVDASAEQNATEKPEIYGE